MEYTQTELRIMALFATIGMLLSYLVGGMNGMLMALLIFIALDYATGMIAAWVTGTICSQRGFEGVLRKLIILMVVVMAHWLDVAIGMPDTFKTMAIFAYLGNEGVSICENIDRMGYGKYIPNCIREKLAQLRDEKEEKRK